MKNMRMSELTPNVAERLCVTLAAAVLLGIAAHGQASFATCHSAKVMSYKYGKYTILALRGEPANFRFTAGMAIDADGAANAYHPKDIKDALDYLRSAGEPGNWWALVTDNDKRNGEPIIQGPSDPFPGYYISTTTLEDKTKPRTDPRRYVDARVVPYFVLPEDLAKQFGSKVGDLGVVIKKARNESEEKVAFAIYADVGPHRKLGEGSIALAKALGIPSSPKTGGYRGPIEYIIFPGSGHGKPEPVDNIRSEAASLWRSYKRLVITCSP